MLTVRSEQQRFGGTIGFYSHPSSEIGAEMRFSVYQPGGYGPFPVLYYLAGLTCTEETFMIKAGALRLAAELGLILVATARSQPSPRSPIPSRCRGARRRSATIWVPLGRSGPTTTPAC
jgi:S-formylglutathione hydrolase